MLCKHRISFSYKPYINAPAENKFYFMERNVIMVEKSEYVKPDSDKYYIIRTSLWVEMEPYHIYIVIMEVIKIYSRRIVA